MGRGQPQYTMVTKQRRKSGCLAGMFHLIGGIFTLGMWPLLVWLTHLFGPKRKAEVTRVYGPPQTPPQQPYPPQGYYPSQPNTGYYGYGQPQRDQYGNVLPSAAPYGHMQQRPQAPNGGYYTPPVSGQPPAPEQGQPDQP